MLIIRCLYVVVLVSSSYMLLNVNAVIVERPTNVLTKEGDRVVFTCSTDDASTPVSWSFLPADGRTDVPETLYFNGRIESDGYAVIVNKSNGRASYDLLVGSVLAKHAGRYFCNDNNGFSETEFASAHLVVVRQNLTPQCDVIELSSCADCKALVIGCRLQYAGFIADRPHSTWTDPMDSEPLTGGTINVTTSSSDGAQFHTIASEISLSCDRLRDRDTSSFVEYDVRLTFERSFDDDDEPSQDGTHVESYVDLTAQVSVSKPRQVDDCGSISIKPVLQITTVIYACGGFLVVLVLAVVVVVGCRLAKSKRLRVHSIDSESAEKSNAVSSQLVSTLTPTPDRPSPASRAIDDANVYDEIADAYGCYQPLCDVASPSNAFSMTSKPASFPYDTLNDGSGVGGREDASDRRQALLAQLLMQELST